MIDKENKCNNKKGDSENYLIPKYIIWLGFFLIIIMPIIFVRLASGGGKFKILIGVTGITVGIILLGITIVIYNLMRVTVNATILFGPHWKALMIFDVADLVIVSVGLSFFQNHSRLWGIHLIEMILLGIGWAILMYCTIEVMKQLIFEKQNKSQWDRVKLILAINVLCILMLSLFMYHLHVVSSCYNAQYKKDPLLFEFSCMSDGNNIEQDDCSISKEEETSHELDNTELQKYLFKSFYYVTTTYTSVGYGDIVPVTGGARLFAIFVSIEGYFMSAIIIGVILGGANDWRTSSLDEQKKKEENSQLENEAVTANTEMKSSG